MANKKKHTAQISDKEKACYDSIKKLKDKMKHQTDALNKILKTIQNEEKK
jgi:hypothetical protein